MKSKCSFILKASTALLLALLMLFGTVATSMAAVVDNADTGAEADVADEGAAVDVADEAADVDLADTGWNYGGKTILIKPEGNWKQNNEKYRFRVWGGDGEALSAVATSYGSGIYKTTIPTGSHTGGQWVRVNASSTNTIWDYGPDWNGTSNALWINGSSNSQYDYWTTGTTVYFDCTANTSWENDSAKMFTKGSNSGTTGGNATTKIATHLYKYTLSSDWDNCGLWWWRGSSASALWNYSAQMDASDAIIGGKNAVSPTGSTVSNNNGTVAALSLTSISAPSLSATTTTPTYGDANTITASGNTLNYSFNGSARTTTLLASDTVYNFYVDGSASAAQSGTTATYDASGLTAGSHTITCTISSALTGLTSSAGSVSITVATPTHTVSRSGSAPSNGTIKFSTDNSTWVDGPITVAEGDNYYVKATPSTGYKISSFTVGGSAVNGASGSTSAKTYTGTMGAADVTAAASFAIQTFNVKKTESGASGGTVKVGNTTIGTSNTSVNYGTNYTVTVTAPTGYNVSAVSGISGTTSGLNTGSVTITGVSITAAKTIAVTYVSAGTCGFTLSANSGSVNIGGTTTFTATPNGYHSSGTISASSSDDTIATVSKSGDTYTVTGVTPGTATITVSCTDTGNTPATYTVTVTAPTVSVTSGASVNVGGTLSLTASSTGATTTPTYTWSVDSGGTYGSISGSTLTGKQPGTVKVKVTASYAGGYSTTATKNVTVATPTVTFNNYSNINIGAKSANASVTSSNTGSMTKTFSIESGSDYVSLADASNGQYYGDAPGTATIKVTYTYGSYSISDTATLTVNDMAVTISPTTKTLDVNGTFAVTGDQAGSTATATYLSGTVENFTSSDDTVVKVIHDIGNNTYTCKALKPGTATITYSFSVTAHGKTTTRTATCAVTVNDLGLDMDDQTAAKGDSVTFTATSTHPASGLGISYAVSPAVTGVSIDSSTGVATVADDCAASSATIVATFKNNENTQIGTKSATLTIEDPEVTVADTADSSVKYLTVGTNYSKALSNNFSGAYTVASSNTSVATVSESSGTLTVVPVAKGTATITVTASKGSTGSNTPGYLKSKLEIAASGADVTASLVGTGIDASMTFTVNVSEAEDYKLILLTANKDSNNWNTAYVYYQYKIGSNPTQTVSLTNMPKIAVNNDGNNVFAYRMPIEHYNNLTLIIFNENSTFGDSWRQTEDITTKSNGYYLTTTYNGDNKRTVGTWTHPVKIPQVSISDVTVAVGETATSTLTNVNNIDVGQTTWSIADTSLASVSDGTVTGVDAGSTTLTAKVWAAKPYNSWTTWTMNDTTLPLIGDSSTAAVSVTADDKTLNFSNKLSLNGSSFDAANPELAGTITATKKNTATTYSDGDSVPHGTDIVFSAVANSGYRLVGWKVGDTIYNTATHEIHISANTTVYALFEKIYTTTINTPSNGTVKVNNANFTGEDVVWNNAPTSITVTPDTGYMIDYANSTNLNKYYTVDTSATTGAVTITGKSDVASGDKTSPSAITVAFKKLSYTVNVSTQYKDDDDDYKAGANTNATGGTITVTNNNGTNTFEYGDIITVTATPNALPAAASFDPAQKYYMVEEIQFSTDGGTTWTHVTCDNESPTYTTAEIHNNTFVINNTGTSEYLFRAKFRGVYFLSIYNSWMQDTNNDWQFVAAPPRKVEVGTGASKRTYTYAKGIAATIGEDNAVSLGAAPTEHHIVDTTGNYHEGNKLLVYAGEEIKLTYSGLASSDAIRGAYFNNALRYTCEEEDDNLFYHRTYRSGGYGKGTTADPYHDMPAGEVPDDDWDYDYAVNTTLYAFEYYYPEPAATTIRTNDDNYIAEIDQSAHTITWTATQNYMNIDLELDYKYKVNINKFTGYKSVLNIENMNDEGFYYNGENFDKSSGGTDRRFKISIDSSSDTTGTYSFTDYNGSFVDASGNPAVVTGVAVVGKKSDGTNAASASEVSYFVVQGNMPNENLYIELPIQKTFKIQMSNIIVTDTAIHRTMLTETDSNSTSDTDSPGTITATVKNAAGEKIDPTGAVIAEDDTTTAQMDISTDGTNYYTYNTGSSSGPGSTNNTDSSVAAYTDSSNNRYLNGGVNVTGSTIPDGYSVTLSYHESNNELGPCYSFIGWYEGSYDSTSHMFTVDYSKKLSGKSTYTYTPKKNTVVIGVGTRDMYLGGTFKNNGDYTDTAADQTWAGNRILMDYDPVTKFYYHTFDEVDGSKVYHLRCYDTASGTKSTNLIAWTNWSGSAYNREHGGTGANAPLATDSINLGRWWESNGHGSDDGKSTAYFCMASGWKAEGYDAPVTVKFKASSGGFDAESTYQWAQAYVSAGRGIDVLGTPTKLDAGTDKERWSTTYNVPSVAVKNKTVNNKDVTVTHQPEKYGATTTDYDVSTKHYEYIDECLVKEDNGEIIVAAYPNDANIDLQAVLVYDIDTKKATAEKTIAYSGADSDDYDGDGNTSEEVYVVNVMIPRATKVYVVPIYKFKDSYIANPDNNMESHTVYVNTEDLNKNDWGGLVAMYSWGTSGGYDSGGWPGQLMIPSDDGKSFYAPLSFFKNGLAGVTFDNYNVIWGGQNINFIGTYKDHSVSDTVYCNNLDTHIHQNYDYREPISIINNINVDTNSDGISDVYLSEDMDLTFALKDGDLTGAPTINTAGSDASNRVSDWKKVGYLTDRSGKNRVDLNGNTVDNATETYRIIAYYTNKYSPSENGYSYNSTSGDGTSYSGSYSINWTVYDTTGTKIIDGTTNDTLSASYTDVVADPDHENGFISYIASKLLAAGQPVTGKAVKIAYENPGTWSEAIRYSGQWYADGVNTLIDGYARVGTISDGVYSPMNNNKLGNDTATVAIDSMNSTIGEDVEGEFEVANKSKAIVAKAKATNGKVSFTATNTSGNFVGWYFAVTDDDGNITGYEPAGANYKDTTITPSFNDDITYYAFYKASAIYNFNYSGRFGSKTFTMQGKDLSEKELADGGTLDKSDPDRIADVVSKLSKITDITVFNKTTGFTISASDAASFNNDTPYQFNINATSTDTTYTTTVYAYNASGTLEPATTVTGTWARKANLGVSYIANKPSGKDNYKFAGWINYGTGSSYSAGNSSTYPTILSTQANLGSSVSDNISIEPFFVATDAEVTALRGTGWQAGIDKVGVTQELTSSTTGRIYTDTLINIRNNEAT
ncbi:MAG: Ig-like domain-containing protein, partial [Ruminococcus sp.]|nr:Ig-like domain-containing protein [Ruminococcus sp.]